MFSIYQDMEKGSQEEVKLDIKSYLDIRYSRFVISNYYFCAQTHALTMLLLSYNFSEGFFLGMKSCVGSPDEPLHEFLHIYTAIVDYYHRLSDILCLRLDQPNIRDVTVLQSAKQLEFYSY